MDANLLMGIIILVVLPILIAWAWCEFNGVFKRLKLKRMRYRNVRNIRKAHEFDEAYEVVLLDLLHFCRNKVEWYADRATKFEQKFEDVSRILEKEL